MNLVIFTPAVKNSAIGRMAALVTRALVAQGNTLTVVRTESPDLLRFETHDFGTTVLPWNDSAKLAPLIELSDALIYQIGNSYELHEGGLHWLERRPGLVCLHDFFLGNLFLGWAKSHFEEANAVLRAWYGGDAADQYFRYSECSTFIQLTHETWPLTEWVSSLALAVITHSNWGCERVLHSCPGPVRVTPLAYHEQTAPQARRPRQSRRDRLQLLTIGHVNTNKRIARVIEAIGSSPLLRAQVNYRLVGHIQPEIESELSTLARKYNVDLLISREVNDADLAQAIEDCDVISCLRWPSLEAASASAIESMLYAKPVIVTDTGFYSELPDACVFKISPHNEMEDLRGTLELLLTDKPLGLRVGANAQIWAARTFTAEAYARVIFDTVEELFKARPALSAVFNFCDVLNRWSEGISLTNLEAITLPLSIFQNQLDMQTDAANQLGAPIRDCI